MSTESGDSVVDAPVQMTMRQARMLDLRTYICALFLIFGLVVTFLGIAPEPAAVDRAAGININLFAGIAMLVLSAVMGLWAWFIPPVPTGRNLPDD